MGCSAPARHPLSSAKVNCPAGCCPSTGRGRGTRRQSRRSAAPIVQCQNSSVYLWRGWRRALTSAIQHARAVTMPISRKESIYRSPHWFKEIIKATQVVPTAGPGLPGPADAVGCSKDQRRREITHETTAPLGTGHRFARAGTHARRSHVVELVPCPRALH
jgi:hypothetical protein